MRIAEYLRVSTEEQAKDGYPHSFAYAKLSMGTGFLEVQREYLESFARKKFKFFLEPMNERD